MRAVSLAWALLALLAIPDSGALQGNGGVGTVHLIFACHLDIGFTDGDIAVINRIFHEQYPRAITVAEELRARGGPERLVFLTHSWIVSLFLDCPSHMGLVCPNATEVEAFKGVVERGDIFWHAFPFNAQLEVFDADLLGAAVDLTHALDRQLGLPPKVTLSQRDVPGMTRAAIPILHGRGVRALSVGVNGMSAPPGVPKNSPFWWKDEPSGKALLALWHPGGYSGYPVDSRDECVHIEGFPHVLCAAWKGDNDGPPSADQVLATYKTVGGYFPGAKVVASTFDDFMKPLLEAADGLNLPVVTGEIGDTWVYGVGSDPGKVAEYRALLRVREVAEEEERSTPEFQKFSRMLMKPAEHTWGKSVGHYLGDWVNWGNKDFHAQLASKADKYVQMVESWQSQRSYTRWAVEELGDSPLGAKAREALQELQALKAAPRPAKAGGFAKADLSQRLLFNSPSWGLELDPRTGAIVGLMFQPEAQGGTESKAGPQSEGASSTSGAVQHGRRLSMLSSSAGEHSAHHGQQGLRRSGVAGAAGINFAGAANPLAQIVYSTYSEDSYQDFHDEYAYIPESDWFFVDFGKWNATVKGGAQRADIEPRLQAAWHKQTADGGLHIVTKATFPSYFCKEAGSPRAVWTEIRSGPTSSELQVDVLWEDKTPTRLPETLWIRWRPSPKAVDPGSWKLHKLGSEISPLEVMHNGSHSQHVVGEKGVSVCTADGGARLRIRSLDAALVSPGAPTPFPKLSSHPNLKLGMAWALSNNIWGTNYALWIPYQPNDTNMRFRFVLSLEEEEHHSGTAASS